MSTYGMTSYFSLLTLIMMTTFLNHLVIGETKIKTTSPTDTIMFDTACKCFANEEHVTLVGLWNNEVLQRSQFFCPLSISYVDITKSDMKVSEKRSQPKLYQLDDYTEVLKPYPSNVFLINEVELSQLRMVLLKLKSSIWWNLYGNFIVKLTKYRNNCMYAGSYLKVFWDFDILKATFLCVNYDHEIDYYTFNPFSDSMVSEWVQTEIFYQKNKHAFRVFKLQNNRSNAICDLFKFDKSKNLWGYPIKLAATHPSTTISYNKNTSKFEGAEVSIAEMIFAHLNASTTISYLSTERRGHSLNDTSVDDILYSVLQGKYDYYINIRGGNKLCKNLVYIYEQTGLCFATQKKYLTLNQRLSKLITWKFLFYFILFYCIITITFMGLTGDTFSAAFFNFLRAIFGASTLSQPLSPIRRIAFSIIIIGIMLMTLLLNSTLCSLVIAPDYEPFLDSEDDLIDNKYALYAPSFWEITLNEISVPNHLKLLVKDDDACILSMKNNPHSTCVIYCSVMKYLVTENSKTHIAEIQDHSKVYYTILHRDNLSFRERLLEITRCSQEGGLMLFYLKIQRSMLYKRNNDSTIGGPISQKQMTITYLFWLYGLIFSSLMFLMEHLV